LGTLGIAQPGEPAHAQPRKPGKDFWYLRREDVKTALVDLRLFVKVAGRHNVNQVITRETLEPILDALLCLWYPVVKRETPVVENDEPMLEKAKPDLIRAEIARLLIDEGLGYLCGMKGDHVRLSNQRTIEELTDMINYLVETFKPEKERRYYKPV
jgi:hypothetical protein